MTKWSKYANLVVAVVVIGGVDPVQGRSVHVELTDAEGETMMTDIPLFMFPCNVKEGTMFYFTRVDEVLELRCGEPPE